MKTALALLVLLLIPTAARAQDRIGYVDAGRAISECVDGKKAIAELNADQATRDKQVADAAAAKKKDPKAKPAPLATDQEWQTAQQNKQVQATQQIVARMKRIFPAIAKERKLSVIAPLQGAVFVDPRLDVTSELIRRYDAGQGKDAPVAAATGDAAKLREENARLRALLATAKKSSVPLPNLDPRASALTTTKP